MARKVSSRQDRLDLQELDRYANERKRKKHPLPLDQFPDDDPAKHGLTDGEAIYADDNGRIIPLDKRFKK